MDERAIQQALELGVQHHEAGRLREAEQLYRRILAEQPRHADAQFFLGVIAHQVGQYAPAVDLIRNAIRLRPNWAEAHMSLGNALKDKGQLAEAVVAYQQAIRLNPGYAEANYNLGCVLMDMGQLDEAIDAFRQAIVLHPKLAAAYNNLGLALRDKGQLDQSAAALGQAIVLDPGAANAYSNLGNTLKDKGQLDEAIAAFGRAIALAPNLPEARSNLGNALRDKGQLDEGIAAFRQALVIRPGYAEAHSNLLLTMQYHPAYGAQAIAEEHRCWNRQHAEPMRKFILVHPNDRSPDRRLRIGYVSSDFYGHPVGSFLLPLLGEHDKREFEVFAYSSVRAPDATTQRLRCFIDGLRSIVGISDTNAADLIRQDRIDILVDLGGHAPRNNLLVFACKPAPLQVSYLGYPDTTGLDTIEYRLTDSHADPPGMSDSFYSERLIRLRESAWCYQPPDHAAEVGAAPFLHTNHITFGSFNTFSKVTEPMIRCWAEILNRVPKSRLLLKAVALSCASVQRRVFQIMQEAGIGADRLDFRGAVPIAEHLAMYNQMDIALDTYPYHGTTTTCEALWMGVPVVTHAGERHVSRVGVSILSNAGLPELVGSNPNQYVQIAVDLANDRRRLIDLRASLRQRMIDSPLMDAATFARNIEAAYRGMWKTWCEGAHSNP